MFASWVHGNAVVGEPDNTGVLPDAGFTHLLEHIDGQACFLAGNKCVARRINQHLINYRRRGRSKFWQAAERRSRPWFDRLTMRCSTSSP